jgi:serine kinase of HPr protein (carbohydrate metabolism regulator)
VLVADDQVQLARAGDRISATAPKALRGLIEVRGVGIIAVACADLAYVTLVADLVPASKIERMPDPALSTPILDTDIPLIRLAPFEPSAAVKLLVRLVGLGGGGSPV